MSRALLPWLAVLALSACSKAPPSQNEPSVIATAPPASSTPSLTGLFPKQSRPSIPIVPGKGVGAIVVGVTLIMVERELGPCTNYIESGISRVCLYPHRGMEVGLKDNTVVRVGLFRDGRRAPGKESPIRYRGFVGETPEGIRLGMPGADVEKQLGKPRKRLRPTGDLENTEDGSRRSEIWDYSDKGLALEMDSTRDGLVVGTLQIPKMDGKPWDGEKK